MGIYIALINVGVGPVVSASDWIPSWHAFIMFVGESLTVAFSTQVNTWGPANCWEPGKMLGGLTWDGLESHLEE